MTKFTNRKEIRYVCGNRLGFHIFIISACSRNVKYILTKIRSYARQLRFRRGFFVIWKCLPEIAPQGHFLALRAQGATAPLGPRNDKSESFTPQNAYRKSCQSAWRSASAATDAIGAYRFHGGLYGSGVRRREGHAPPLQRITGSYGKNSTFHSQFSPSGGRLSPNRYLQ